VGGVAEYERVFLLNGQRGAAKMNVITDNGFLGIDKNSHVKEFFDVLAYDDGCFSLIPYGFFTTWMGAIPNFGTFHIGKCSVICPGTKCRYDFDQQGLKIGRFVSIGQRCSFILNGLHPLDYVSTSVLSTWGMQLPPIRIYGDTILENDIWVGDEVMILGGAKNM
jgi:hypothetical protein